MFRVASFRFSYVPGVSTPSPLGIFLLRQQKAKALSLTVDAEMIQDRCRIPADKSPGDTVSDQGRYGERIRSFIFVLDTVQEQKVLQ